MSKNIALVLSSGGARGIAHIGVINELQKAGYTITSLAGTSMGSLVGGIYANGKLPEFTEWLLSMTGKMDVIKFLDLTVGQGGFVKGEKIIKALESFIGNSKIEDLPIPYTCIATDLAGQKEVAYKTGSLLHAVRASISIPTVFKPVTFGSCLLVDGGVLNPLPLDVVERNPDDMLVAVNVNANIDYQKPKIKHTTTKEHAKQYGKVRAVINQRWSGMVNYYSEKYSFSLSRKQGTTNLFDIISDSINLSQNRICQLYIEKYPPDIMIDISHRSATAFDFYKSEELIQAGREACLKVLKENKNN